jgi:hypothetical protein
VPISKEAFVLHYPRLYHMAEAGTWDSIRRHGLLSTTALLDLFEVKAHVRRTIEGTHRPDSVTISHSKYGRAVIRDQKPMRESALTRCLQGMTPHQWYRLLNRRVFFWVTERRLIAFLNARAYRDRTHTVLILDTTRLVEQHPKRVVLSPINSGSTIYNPHERGRDTFLPFSRYPFAERRALRGVADAVAECAVIYSVPGIRDCTLRVEERRGTEVVDVLWEEPPSAVANRQ